MKKKEQGREEGSKVEFKEMAMQSERALLAHELPVVEAAKAIKKAVEKYKEVVLKHQQATRYEMLGRYGNKVSRDQIEEAWHQGEYEWQKHLKTICGEIRINTDYLHGVLGGGYWEAR